MKKFFFILLISSLLSSCQRILMKMYGIKNPDVENERSIKKSALKYQLDTTNIVTVCSKDFLRLLHRRGIPDGGIYDRNGK